MIQATSQQHRTETHSPSPQTGILRSSEALGWSGIVLEQRYHPAGEYVFPSTSAHLIGLHQGPPITVEHVHNGRHIMCLHANGSVQIVPAGTTCIWRHHDGADHLHLLLTPALLQQVAADHDHQPIELRDQFTMQDARIEHMSFALLTELLEGGLTGRLSVEGLAQALAAHLIHAYARTMHSRPQSIIRTKRLPASLLRRSTALIEEHLAEDLSLATLAAEVGLSLSGLFRRTTGLSPHQYVVQRRLEHAQQLLRSTRISIGAIATTVGFYDQSHLVRQMRRVMGVTPTQMREHLS